jgi:hypothetical protein
VKVWQFPLQSIFSLLIFLQGFAHGFSVIHICSSLYPDH